MNPWKFRLILYCHRKLNRYHRNADWVSSGISTGGVVAVGRVEEDEHKKGNWWLADSLCKDIDYYLSKSTYSGDTCSSVPYLNTTSYSPGFGKAKLFIW